MMQVYKTACGGSIMLPPKAEDHLRAHPEVMALLQEAIEHVELPKDGSFLAVEVEMGRVIGRSGCVATPPIGLDDQGFFAVRVGRTGPSRVALDTEGPETTKVVILAFVSRESRGQYVLVTSFVGELAQKEPWDPNIRSQEEFQCSLEFWGSHALVYDSSVMSDPFVSTWRQMLS